jgi:hypothetical protein
MLVVRSPATEVVQMTIRDVIEADEARELVGAY